MLKIGFEVVFVRIADICYLLEYFVANVTVMK